MPAAIHQKLSSFERADARYWGQTRHMAYALAARSDPKSPEWLTGLEAAMLTTLAERAACVAAGRRWVPDQDPGFTVRTCGGWADPLLVYPADPAGRRIVLVRCYCQPIFEVQGWVWSDEARRVDWWSQGQAVYEVPNMCLRPIDSLTGMV